MNCTRYCPLLLAFLLLVASGAARADAFAQSILLIDHFRLLHANGTPYRHTDFGMIDGANSAYASVLLDGQGSAVHAAPSGLRAAAPDLPQQFIGVAASPYAENAGAPLATGSAAPGTFSHADQGLGGSALGDGARASSRAAAVLARAGSASAESGLGVTAGFNFILGVGDSITVAFDGTPFASAYAGAGEDTAASARMSWSVNLRNLSTGEIVFAYQPGELNGMGSVSRTDSFPGLTTYNPGTLAFSASTPLLNTFDTYQLTVNHSTMASALQAGAAVPAPATLMLLGLGLLLMWSRGDFDGRQRKAEQRKNAVSLTI